MKLLVWAICIAAAAGIMLILRASVADAGPILLALPFAVASTVATVVTNNMKDGKK